MNTIEHGGKEYPAFQAEGNASQFAIPFARKVCKGIGYDIGYGKEEWKLPGAIGIDLEDTSDKCHADSLPDRKVDYIYSSHCLEHVPHWVSTLDLWFNHLAPGGVIFLYLPDLSQTYWRPWSNRKHIHCFTPEILTRYLEDTDKCKKFSVSGVDLNNSFMCMAEV